MARPQTCFIDAEEVFQGIKNALAEDLAACAEWVAEAAAALKAAPKNFYRRREHHQAKFVLQNFRKFGVEYSIERFLGRTPTGTERQRVQKIIRDMVDAGRIVRSGRFLLPVETTTNGA